MATNTLGTVARQYASQQVHYLRLDFTFASVIADSVHVGWIPAGATIIKPASGVNVDVVFNAGTNNLLDIGTAADRDLYGTLLALTSIAFVPLDEAVAMSVSVDTEIQINLAITGNAATTGKAQVVIAYVLSDQSY